MNKILEALVKLQRDVDEVKKKVNDIEPAYGSKAWWEHSDNRALKSIKAGKGIKIKNKSELNRFFESL